MTDIRRWLTEDEVEALRVARAATPGPWVNLGPNRPAERDGRNCCDGGVSVDSTASDDALRIYGREVIEPGRYSEVIADDLRCTADADHIAANDPSRVIASLEGTARLREVLHATRDHWIAHHDAVLGVYALSNEWRGDDLRVAGLEGVRDYLLDHAPCGNGPLERALRALLEGFPRDLEPKP